MKNALFIYGTDETHHEIFCLRIIKFYVLLIKIKIYFYLI